MEIHTQRKISALSRISLFTGSVSILLILALIGSPDFTVTECDQDNCSQNAATLQFEHPSSQSIELPSKISLEKNEASLYWSIYDAEGKNLVRASKAHELFFQYDFSIQKIKYNEIIFHSKNIPNFDFTYKDSKLLMPGGNYIYIEPEYLYELTGTPIDTLVEIERDNKKTEVVFSVMSLRTDKIQNETIMLLGSSGFEKKVYTNISLNLMKGKNKGASDRNTTLDTADSPCSLPKERQSFSRKINILTHNLGEASKSLKKQLRSKISKKIRLSRQFKNSLKISYYNMNLLKGMKNLDILESTSLDEASKRLKKAIKFSKSSSLENLRKSLSEVKKLSLQAKRIFQSRNTGINQSESSECVIPDYDQGSHLISTTEPTIQNPKRPNFAIEIAPLEEA